MIAALRSALQARAASPLGAGCQHARLWLMCVVHAEEISALLLGPRNQDGQRVVGWAGCIFNAALEVDFEWSRMGLAALVNESLEEGITYWNAGGSTGTCGGLLVQVHATQVPELDNFVHDDPVTGRSLSSKASVPEKDRQRWTYTMPNVGGLSCQLSTQENCFVYCHC